MLKGKILKHKILQEETLQEAEEHDMLPPPSGGPQMSMSKNKMDRFKSSGSVGGEDGKSYKARVDARRFLLGVK